MKKLKKAGAVGEVRAREGRKGERERERKGRKRWRSISQWYMRLAGI